jgi:hypothetical protein
VRKISIFLLVLLFLGNLGCAKKGKNDGCIQKLSEKIQVGASQGDAERTLDQCGFTHSFDQKTSIIYGLKHNKQSGLIREDWSAQIKLDAGRKVTSVKIEKVFTGP